MTKPKIDKGTKPRSECIDIARQSLNLFTDDELHSYIKQVATETRKFNSSGVPFARNAAIKAINKEHLESLLNDSASAARDIGKWDNNKSKMDNGIRPKSFVDKTKENTDANIETANNAAKQELSTRSFGELSKEEMDLLAEGKLNDEIYFFADGGEHTNSMVRKIGRALKEYIDPRNAALIASDAMKPAQMNKDRFFRNNYNQSKMLKMGKENWVSLHKSRIDVQATFENTKAMRLDGSLDDAIIDEMIGNTFDNIIEGNGPLFTKASVARDAQRIERSRHMFYKYKDWKSWGMSDNDYGQGSLMKAWIQDINASGNQIGMARIMGTNPEMMWNKMREVQVAKEPQTFKTKREHEITDAVFNNLLGVNRGVYDPSLANMSASLRAITSMARLGKILLRSIPDITNIAGFAQRAGMPFWETYFDSIIHSFNLIDSDARKQLARQLGHGLDIHTGTMSRYIETQGLGDSINKFSNKFFYSVGLEAWDRGNRLNAMAPIMKGYGRQSSKKFSALNEQQQSYLRRFNISDAEWDGLRVRTQKNLFGTDNVTTMSDAEVRELWEKTDKSTPLSEYRSALYRKVYSMFDTAQEFSVLYPTAYSNTITTLNTRAGTGHGEIVRLLTQFKGYPIQYMRRIFVGGMQDFDSYQARMMYGLNMALGTIMLTQMSDVLMAISNGLTPPNPAHMSKSEIAKYYSKMVFGGMGVFGTILGGGESAKEAFGSFVATPSMKALYDPLKTAISLTTGNLSSAESAVKDFVKVANPIGTHPAIAPFVDAFMGNKPYMEPGQRPLF